MSPEEYKALYAKHGVIPDRWCYVVVEPEHGGECHACALGIRLIEQLGSFEAAHVALWSRNEVLHSEAIVALLRGKDNDPDLQAYLVGVDNGFTYSKCDAGNEPQFANSSLAPLAYKKGYAEGRAAGQALGVE